MVSWAMDWLPVDRGPRLPPRMRGRVAAMAVVACALFGVVFFRLWSLEILSGPQFRAQAATNRDRSDVVPAPRGDILDRNGNVLVDNRPGVAVVVTPSKLPPQGSAARHDLYVRLSGVLGLPTNPAPCVTGGTTAQRDTQPRMQLECVVDDQVFRLPYANVTVKEDANRAAYVYIAERAQEFPGVTIQDTWLRNYPLGSLGAQVFGITGQLSPQDMSDPKFRGVKGGTRVGHSGLEYVYDPELRGVDGADRVAVDALGQLRGTLSSTPPKPGLNLRTSLDLGLEQAGQQGLQAGMSLAHNNGNPAPAGAFVAMDPRNGQVLAMGSLPSFDPSIYNKPFTQSTGNRLFGAAAHYPQVNRATQTGYPTGSTFKVVTASAGLAAGLITPSTIYNDTGSFDEGGVIRRNAGGAVYGPVDLQKAIQESVDTYFFSLGHRLNSNQPQGGALQAWARDYGFGTAPTADLGREEPGIVPTPAWRHQRVLLQDRCLRTQPPASCGYSDGREWSPGDNTNLGVGQGDFLATPLQMAVAYAALENGGTVVAPHVGVAFENGGGQVVRTLSDPPVRQLRIPSLSTIRAGLHDAAMQPGGTSYDVMGDFPKPVYGKTGTAQHQGQADQSWYVCFVPDPSRPIVIAVTIEGGGFGDQAAAPAARLMLSQWFNVRKVVKGGTSRTY